MTSSHGGDLNQQRVTSASPLRATLRFIAAIVQMAAGRAALTALLMLAVGLAEGAGLLVLVPLLQLVGVDAQQGSLGRVLSGFRRAFAFVGLTPTLESILILYVLIVCVQSYIQRRQSIVQTKLREHVVHTLRTQLHRAIFSTTWVYFSRRRATSFGQLLTERVDRVATAAYLLMDIFVTGVIALIYVLLALQVSAVMTMMVVGCGTLLALALRDQLGRAQQAGEQFLEASTALHAATFDHLASMKIIKGYGSEARHAATFSRLSQALSSAGVGAMTASAGVRQTLAIGSALLLAVMVYVAQGVMHMAPASLFLLIFLFARLVPRVTLIYEKGQALAGELPAFTAVVDAEQECLAAAEHEPLSHETIDVTRAIECREVTFRYQNDGRPAALDHVTLNIPAHTTTAIVGPSGAGKSTIADLLMGLITPATGSVLVDGQALTAERLTAWRGRIGYVAQETLLFHDTVRENLRWARPSATDDEIWTALSRSAAAEFVRALPHGLDTVIGDHGVLVSGGERQRLSLARAILREPQVLILDEATSALDSENERRIQAAIDGLHEQITIIVITHRLSTLRNADQICVLEQGRVKETGTWQSLTSNTASRFHTLANAQNVDLTTIEPLTDAASGPQRP